MAPLLPRSILKSMSALRGINLGGWLVIERWITPTLFQGTTAMTERELVASRGGKTKIRSHHKNFITEKDIAWLASQNFELLRVPVGYWIFGDEPDFVGAIERLDWLMEAADRYNLQVLIDLHAAPGAQNHKQHNGGTEPVDDWLRNKAVQQKTIWVLAELSERYRGYKNLWGIELLNEPEPGMGGLRLAWFYRRAYRRVCEVARPGMRVIFSDAYSPILMANTFGWLARRDHPVVMDVHIYYVFGEKNKRTKFERHVRMPRGSKWLIRLLSVFQPVMIGEWTAALPYGVSMESAKQFANAQIVAYDDAEAWCYWTYKTEGSSRWDYRWMANE